MVDFLLARFFSAVKGNTLIKGGGELKFEFSAAGFLLVRVIFHTQGKEGIEDQTVVIAPTPDRAPSI